MTVNNYVYRTGGRSGFPGTGNAPFQWQPVSTAHDPNPPITLEDASGSSVIIGGDAAAAGISAVTGIAAAVASALAAASGIAATNGLAAAVLPAVGAATGAATTNGISGTVIAAVASASAGATVAANSGAVAAAVAASAGSATTDGISGTIVAAVASSSAGATAQADAEAVTAVSTPRGFQMDYGVFTKPRRRKDEPEKVVPNYDEEIAVLLLAA